MVLSDSDVFTVGIKDFNPNELFNNDNPELGTEDSVANRKKYGISTLPMSFRLNDEEEQNKHEPLFRMSGLATDENVRWGNETVLDDFRQVILSIPLIDTEYKLDEHWTITLNRVCTLMRYENTMDYNGATGKSYAPFLMGIVIQHHRVITSTNPI